MKLRDKRMKLLQAAQKQLSVNVHVIGVMQQKLKMITMAKVGSPPLELLTALLCFQRSPGQAAEFKQPAALQYH